MSRILALVLAVTGVVFVHYAQQEGFSLTTGKSGFYLAVAFSAFVNAALFAAVDFVEE